MKNFIDKFLKLSSTVRLSLLVSVLLVLAIGLSFSNTFFVQQDNRILDDSISSKSVLAEATGYYVSPTLYCLGSCDTPTPAPTNTPIPVVSTISPTPSIAATSAPTMIPCPSGTTSIGQTTSVPPTNICVNNTPTPTMEPTPTQAPTSTPKPTKAPTPTFIPCPSGTVPIGKTLDKPTQFICGTPTPTNVPEPTKCIDPSPSVTPEPTVSPFDALLKQIKDLLDILCKSFGLCDEAVPSVEPSAEPSVEPTQALSPEHEAVKRIEAGGIKNFKDKSGNLWQKDRGFVGGDTVDRGDIRIRNTQNPRIYQTEHWGMGAANYKVPDGDYQVRLHFAETYSGVKKAGQRVFDIDVNGEKIKDLDVFAQAKGRNKALIKSVDVKVTDGKITFKFKAKKGAPEINGIEILKIVPFCEIEITPTLIPSISISPSEPASASPTLVPSISVTIPPTATPTATIAPSPTITLAPTVASTATPTPAVGGVEGLIAQLMELINQLIQQIMILLGGGTTAPTGTSVPSPTNAPTSSPTPSPTSSPTPSPTSTPTPSPTSTPTPSPTSSPTPSPTIAPTATLMPTSIPSPTLVATNTPTIAPSVTIIPTPTSTPPDMGGLIKILLDLITQFLNLITSLFS